MTAGLSDTDLTSLADDAKAGRRRTVYLSEAVPSLGVEAGTSARVMSVAGTTVTLRPKGVEDDLSYEAHELRLHKTAPLKTKARSTATKATRTTVPAEKSAVKLATKPVTKPAAKLVAKPVTKPVTKPAAKRASPAAAQVRTTPPATDHNPADSAEEYSARELEQKFPAAVGARRTPAPKGTDPTPTLSPAPLTASQAPATPQPEPVTATLVGSPDGTWALTVTRGTGREAALAAFSVTPAAATATATALNHHELSAAVTELVAHAHSATARRIAELRSQLDQAEADLTGFSSAS